MRTAYNTIDRTGQVFSSWTIVSYSHTDIHRKRHYLCRCVCGYEITKELRHVLQGKSKSCGCKNIENHIKHGMSKTKVYRAWKAM